MTDSKIFKLIDLIEDIKKVDEMIVLHKGKAGSEFMLSQYQAKKTSLAGHLITELNSPLFKSDTGIFFIKRVLDKFYTDLPGLSPGSEMESNNLRKLEAAL